MGQSERLRMRVFKSKWFAKFARKECISDAKLCEVVKDADAGKIDVETLKCVLL
jgi:hypothetical protein